MKSSNDSIFLRLANGEDSKLIFEWRNAPENYRYFLAPQSVTWQEHIEWFNNALANPFRMIIIGEIGGIPFGVVRFDLENDKTKATVSIHLAPSFHGKKLGTPLLAQAEIYLKNLIPTVVSLEALISVENIPSYKVFHNNSFEDRFYVLQKKV